LLTFFLSQEESTGSLSATLDPSHHRLRFLAAIYMKTPTTSTQINVFTTGKSHVVETQRLEMFHLNSDPGNQSLIRPLSGFKTKTIVKHFVDVSVPKRALLPQASSDLSRSISFLGARIGFSSYDCPHNLPCERAHKASRVSLFNRVNSGSAVPFRSKVHTVVGFLRRYNIYLVF